MPVFVGSVEIGFVEQMDEETEFSWYGVLNDSFFGPGPGGYQNQTDFYSTADEARAALVSLYQNGPSVRSV